MDTYDAAETARKHKISTCVTENNKIRQSVAHCYTKCIIYTPLGIDDKMLISSCTTKLNNSHSSFCDFTSVHKNAAFLFPVRYVLSTLQ